MTVKALVFLLLSASLVLGLVGAMTAYAPPLSLADEALEGLTLNAPAGAQAVGDGPVAPLARKGDRLTPERLAALRSSGETRVKVKEFALARWTGWPFFVLGCAGLCAGAWLARRESRRALAGAEAAGAGGGDAPEVVLESITRTVDELRAALPAAADDRVRQRRILDALTPIQDVQVPAFVAARSRLIARFGMGGYARLMDRFAAAERQVNRAWSAAADGYVDESTTCLEAAAELLRETGDRLKA